MSAKKVTDFNPMEAELEAAFQPVRPSKRFVQTIRSRIHINPPVQVRERIANTRSLLLILGGVLSVSLLIVTTVRAIFYFVNRSRA